LLLGAQVVLAVFSALPAVNGQLDADFGKADISDLKRARLKVPGAAYKGDSFQNMSSTLNQWILKQVPKSRRCEDYTVEQLQQIQLTLFMLRDPQLDDIYQQSQDNRRIRRHSGV